MAGEKVATIDKWLGVNYCPDGDVDLKVGEAAEMVNWKVTRSGNLKTRQGYSPYYVPLDNEKIIDVWQFKQNDGQVIDLVLIKHTQPYLTPIITYHCITLTIRQTEIIGMFYAIQAQENQ